VPSRQRRRLTCACSWRRVCLAVVAKWAAPQLRRYPLGARCVTCWFDPSRADRRLRRVAMVQRRPLPHPSRCTLRVRPPLLDYFLPTYGCRSPSWRASAAPGFTNEVGCSPGSARARRIAFCRPWVALEWRQRLFHRQRPPSAPVVITPSVPPVARNARASSTDSDSPKLLGTSVLGWA